jgi:Holliday junction resolvase|tara:strand:- start:2094 stop:2396 length:303 start_codon:yes stop_codon:yes gene_type:complete
MRKKARVDANQKEIVQELRKRGISVLHTHQLGKGAPDIVVGYMNSNYLIELKDGNKSKSQQRLTKDELDFSLKWRGNYAVCNSLEQILLLIDYDKERATT